MADKKILIAAASSDGKNVDLHFGKSADFYIYSVDGDNASFTEHRHIEPACNGGGHDAGRIEAVVSALKDCEYLLVAKIGPGAERIARAYGIEPFEIPGDIDDSIEKLIKFIQVQDLFS